MFDAQSVLDAIPGYYVLKDLNSVIVLANQRLKDVVGFDDIRDYIGGTDYDIKSAAVECAEQFIKQDKEVMASGEAIQFIDFSHINGDNQAMLKSKAPYYDAAGL